MTVEGPLFELDSDHRFAGIGDVMSGLGDLARLIERLEWRTADHEGVRVPHFEIIPAAN
ncbi:MAG: hypothetical protein ACYTG0_05375 [Planctomycetota bacterium]